MALSKIDSDSLNSPITAVNLAYTGTLTGGTGVVNLGSGQVYKDASGNLGIGTSSPTSFNGSGLQISRTSSNATLSLTRTDGTSSDIRSGVLALTLNVDPQNSVADSFIQFSVDNTERARIDSSGNLLVNRTTQSSNGQYSADFGGTSRRGAVYNNTETFTASNFVSFSDRGTVVGTIVQNGASTVSYTTSSDYRLKEDIAPMTGALATVAALKPVTYKWKVDGSDGQGFIAHELAEVVPDCVTGEKDAVDADGNPQYQGIDVSFLVATLTAAIQELKAEFDAYKDTHP